MNSDNTFTRDGDWEEALTGDDLFTVFKDDDSDGELQQAAMTISQIIIWTVPICAMMVIWRCSGPARFATFDSCIMCWFRLRECRWVPADYLERLANAEREEVARRSKERLFKTNLREIYIQNFLRPYTMTLRGDDIEEDTNHPIHDDGDDEASRSDDQKEQAHEGQNNAVSKDTIGDEIDVDIESGGELAADVKDGNEDAQKDMDNSVVKESCARSDIDGDDNDNDSGVHSRENTEDDKETSSIIDARGYDGSTGDAEGDEEQGGELPDDFAEEICGTVRVPIPGYLPDKDNSGFLTTSDATKFRWVPNGCSVCISSFDAGDDISWSSNPECTHVFHYECIRSWFFSVGKKLNNDDHRFNMHCPCCRQLYCLSTDDIETQPGSSFLE